MSKSWSRREALRALSLATASLPLAGIARDELGQVIHLPQREQLATLGKPVTAITLGAGSRGNVYGNFGAAYPDQLDIIGVAEPIAVRNQRYAEKHNIAADKRFKTWEDVFKMPKFADAVIITTPDDLHYGPAMAALKAGYDVLLEKPIAPTEKECRDILALAQKTKRIVAVCHVLRYAPYFQQLHELLRTESIGRLVSIQHFEPIEHQHMSHSFVRGNWHNSKQTTPIILAKSCHDLDILRWLVGRPAQKIHAFGNLTWFRKENAPKGSTERCLDCPVADSCPYAAQKLYLKQTGWRYVFDLPENKAEHEAAVKELLKTTNYGRCVYRMDNDQPDHYIANIQFADDITASFSMEAFTSYHGRRTRIMGSHGDIVGDMSTFVHTNFLTGEKKEWTAETDGHGGGDWRLAASWVEAVSKQDASLLSSTIDASVESHLMAFSAEKSRKKGSVENIVL